MTHYGTLFGVVCTTLLYPLYCIVVRFIKKAPDVVSVEMFAWDAVNGGATFPQVAIIYALLIEQPVADFLTGNEALVAISSLFMMIHVIGHPFRQTGQQKNLSDST